MKMVFFQLRLTLAVILLIVASVVAGAIGHGSAASASGRVAASVAVDSASTSHKVINQVAFPDRGSQSLSCDGCMGCVHSASSSCCAVGISAGDCAVFHDAAAEIRFMAGKVFLATGIDPEALLQPPQHLA